MPPRKKPKTAPAREASLENDNSTVASSSTAIPEPVISDGWTDEQETTLFKAISIYKLKPAGIHKHFQMLAISELMKNHGVADSNTTIPGIWSKLKTLYNLDGLDEREDIDDEGSDSSSFREFHLPKAEFGHLMDQRRFRKDGDNSPPSTPGSDTNKSTRDDSEELSEPQEDDDTDVEELTPSPEPARTTRRGRPRGRGRGGTTRGGRRGRGRPRNVDREPVTETEDDQEEDEGDDSGKEGETEGDGEDTIDEAEDGEDEERTTADDDTEDDDDESEEKEPTPKKRRGRSATTSARRGKTEGAPRRRGRPPKADSVRRSKRNK